MAPKMPLSAVIKVDKNINLGPVNLNNLQQLRVLNESIFPVQYQDSFYKDVLKNPQQLSKLTYFKDIMVGTVCCKLEDQEGSELKKLYILTLGVLAPYRGQGIGTQMLNYVLKQAAAMENVESVYLHVQTDNDDAVSFYKKFDFEVVDTIEGYYKRIQPSSCFVLEKKLKSSP